MDGFIFGGKKRPYLGRDSEERENKRNAAGEEDAGTASSSNTSNEGREDEVNEINNIGEENIATLLVVQVLELPAAVNELQPEINPDTVT